MRVAETPLRRKGPRRRPVAPGKRAVRPVKRACVSPPALPAQGAITYPATAPATQPSNAVPIHPPPRPPPHPPPANHPVRKASASPPALPARVAITSQDTVPATQISDAVPMLVLLRRAIRPARRACVRILARRARVGRMFLAIALEMITSNAVLMHRRRVVGDVRGRLLLVSV